jgi:uncharacterized membrane protein
MNLAPLLAAPLAIQVHVLTVVPAAFLGAAIFLMRKGTAQHRLLGRIWLMLMIASALSSFFIHSINLVYGFSPIHLLSLFVLFGAYRAYSAARRRQISAHMKWIFGIYLGGIVGAGLFTFLPGRLMNEMLLDNLGFDSAPEASQVFALVVVLMVFAALAFIARRALPTGLRPGSRTSSTKAA